jgi:hypothetical protein
MAASAVAAPRVELEVVTETGFPPEDTHQWMAMLGGVTQSSVRIRTARGGDKPEIRQRGSGASATYYVTGVLTRRNSLLLPGGEFRRSDRTGIANWIAKLKEGGEEGLYAKPAAFGLTASQLVEVHEALSARVTTRTQGQKSFDVLTAIARGLPLSFSADASARHAMAAGDVVAEEMNGLSAGTAMAAVLRPLGLVLVPRKQASGQIQLSIMDVRRSSESWPVGWPPEKSPRETFPKLFDFLNVEIEDTPLDQALAAIGGRLEAPLLLDHNSLARQRIEPAQIKVSLPSKRTYYKQIIDRLLYQAKLTSEIRVDEAGSPFLWVSTKHR